MRYVRKGQPIITRMLCVNSGTQYIYIQYVVQLFRPIYNLRLGHRRIGPLSSTPLLWKITLATRSLNPQNSRHSTQVLHSSPFFRLIHRPLSLIPIPSSLSFIPFLCSILSFSYPSYPSQCPILASIIHLP